MNAIYHDVFIKSSAEDVFTRISDPEHLINWWPLTCSADQQTDGLYNFFFEEAYNWWGKAIVFEPSKSLHIKMTDSDSDWNPTTFGFDLRTVEEGVWLEFWHKGWPENNHHFRRSSHCWAMLLQGLKEYIEQDKIIPFSDRS